MKTKDIIDSFYNHGGNAKALEQHRAIIGGEEGARLLDKRCEAEIKKVFEGLTNVDLTQVQFRQGDFDVLRMAIPRELAITRRELIFHTRVAIDLRKYCSELEARIAALENQATTPEGA